MSRRVLHLVMCSVVVVLSDFIFHLSILMHPITSFMFDAYGFFVLRAGILTPMQCALES